MTEDHFSSQLAKVMIDDEKWSSFLRRFVDVLRVNIFMVDPRGKVLIEPLGDIGGSRYGGQLLFDSFGFDLAGDANMLSDFDEHGCFLEARDPFDLRMFAIPISVEDIVISYLIVGPVILNKRWLREDYINVGNQLGIDMEKFLNAVQDLRIVSYVNINAILGLLAEVVKDVAQLSFEKRKIDQDLEQGEAPIPREIADAAEDLYMTIHLDELLVTVLDLALSLTQAECGSLMILDEEHSELVLKVSRGIDDEKVRDVRVKVGEGVAGQAAKYNKTFVISGTSGERRIRRWLKRPEIRQSVVLPLTFQGKVLGVLNLHTKKVKNPIESNIDNLRHLSRLVSTAINSL